MDNYVKLIQNQLRDHSLHYPINENVDLSQLKVGYKAECGYFYAPCVTRLNDKF
jgi:hypothetical protein